MYTYIIECQDYIKIGFTTDMNTRLNAYNTHNPLYKVLRVIDGNYESFLHRKFSNKRFKNEWFLLNEEDVNFLLTESLITTLDIEITEEKVERERREREEKAETIKGIKTLQERIDLINAEKALKKQLEMHDIKFSMEELRQRLGIESTESITV